MRCSMKNRLPAMLLAMAILAGSGAAFADNAEPTVYVIQKGDTLWGLSDRFIKDPYYWPNMWAANNPLITNPHFIFPGQQVKVYKDRIVVEPATPGPQAPQPSQPETQTSAAKTPSEQAVPERTFPVQVGVGYLVGNDFMPAGTVISTYQNRQLIGEDDVTYTDIGKQGGAKAGDRFAVLRDMGAVSHPVTNVIVGHKIIPLGVLQLSELERNTSRAIVTKSYLEINAGSLLVPYRDKRREVALKGFEPGAERIYCRLSDRQQDTGWGRCRFPRPRLRRRAGGGQYAVCLSRCRNREAVPSKFDKLPVEVLGAVVVVETSEKTSSAVVVKGIDTMYIGDRVELKKENKALIFLKKDRLLPVLFLSPPRASALSLLRGKPLRCGIEPTMENYWWFALKSRTHGGKRNVSPPAGAVRHSRAGAAGVGS